MNSTSNIWINNTNNLTEDFFSELVKTHYPLMFNFGYTVCTDEELVKDTIQDLFLTIWENRNRLNIQFTKSYFLKSLRNNLIAAQKKSDRGQSVPFSEKCHEWEESIETVIIANQTEEESVSQLKEILKSLSKKNKEVVFLKYYQGFSNDEVADILSINKQSVANTVHRILSAIRKNLPANYAALLILFKFCFASIWTR